MTSPSDACPPAPTLLCPSVPPSRFPRSFPPDKSHDQARRGCEGDSGAGRQQADFLETGPKTWSPVPGDFRYPAGVQAAVTFTEGGKQGAQS